MAQSTKDLVGLLNDLIETNTDGEKGYRDAADGVQNVNLRGIFNEYALQRRQFAGELQTYVTRLGGDPATSGSAGAALHRGWMNVKAAITGKDEHAVLEECERGEDSAVKSYREALSQGLPDDFRGVVEEQYRQILEAHNRIKALRDGTSFEETEVTAVAGTEVPSDITPEGAIPVIQEELAVGKRTVQRGGVKVRSRIVEQPVEQDVQLREENVRVERRPVDRPVTEADINALRDQTIEVAEMAEELVVQKKARVVEEVSVTKDATQRTEKVRDTLKRTEVETEKL